MASGKLKIVHYVNQFFGKQGKEEKADMLFLVKKGPVGPGTALQEILGDKGEVVATLICGDNYFAEHIENAPEEGFKLIEKFKPDLFFAGPAFEAGRYGLSCGAMCKVVNERLGIPSITGMYDENPGVELYRRDVYICKAERSVAKMAQDLTRMVNLGLKLVSKDQDSRLVSRENMGDPSEDGYFPRGLVRNAYTEKTQAERAVDMLLAKLKGESFQTETEVPRFQAIQSPSPIKDMGSAAIALVSDGGLTLKGNPDNFSGRGENSWAAYDIETFFPEKDPSMEYAIEHTGYFPKHVMDNTNRLVPVDVIRDFEKEGVIGKIHPLFYSTSGNGTSQECCIRMGQEIAEALKERGVDGVILTST